ncbi:MAG: LuxR C-terminal-related transcriptional regulator, partial [Chloroflexota bacterium]|nr:LuxR C-terminal-related transcriptional regulator [Chloroflexota bacterium]
NTRLALEWAIANDPETGLRLARAFSWIWFVRGAVPESQHWLVQGLESAGDVADDLRAGTLWWIGANATTLGQYARARATHEEALAIYGDRDNEVGVANCLHGLGRIEQFAGDPGRAVERYQAAAELFRQHHVPRLMVTLSNLGLALLESDKLDQASAVLDEALALAERHGLPWHRAQILDAQGSVALMRGDLPLARCSLRRSVELCRAAGDPRFVAQALETCAWLATVEGAAEHAARLLGAASRMRDTIGVPVSQSARRKYDRYVPVIHAQLGLAGWQRAWAEGNALSQTEAIDVALAGVTLTPEPAPPPDHRHAGLSAREMDVLRLIVEGKSDREIAAALFISHHTVMRHVSNVLGKLDVKSRTAAATYAVRHDLR